MQLQLTSSLIVQMLNLNNLQLSYLNAHKHQLRRFSCAAPDKLSCLPPVAAPRLAEQMLRYRGNRCHYDTVCTHCAHTQVQPHSSCPELRDEVEHKSRRAVWSIQRSPSLKTSNFCSLELILLCFRHFSLVLFPLRVDTRSELLIITPLFPVVWQKAASDCLTQSGYCRPSESDQQLRKCK